MAAPNVARVYEAVVAGESAERLRALIDEGAQGDDERRKAAVDQPGEHEGEAEIPLLAAERLDRGDLVGVLLEAGADPRESDGCGRVTPLFFAITHGFPDTVRFLLKAGHDPNERIYLIAGAPLSRQFFTAVHLCIRPLPKPLAMMAAAAAGEPLQAQPLKLDCLEILVREGGADVNARDVDRRTAMHYLAHVTGDCIPALDLLVQSGADVSARSNTGRTPIFFFADRADLDSLRRLLDHGASPDDRDDEGASPLMCACWSNAPSCRRDVAFELMRRSSAETLHAVDEFGRSAADFLVRRHLEDGQPIEPWRLQLLGQLLSAGVRMSLEEDAALLVPVAAARAQQLAAELAARRSEARRWRAHDAFVGLALDKQEEREAAGVVAAKVRRVAALELELGAGGTDSDGESDEASESDSESESESETSGDSKEDDDDDDDE